MPWDKAVQLVEHGERSGAATPLRALAGLAQRIIDATAKTPAEMPERVRAFIDRYAHVKPPSTLYVGKWSLIPGLSLYQSGTPPRMGLYGIHDAADGQLLLTVKWMVGDMVEMHSVTFGGPPDGTLQRFPGDPSGDVQFSLTHVNERTLDSESFAGSRKTGYARRVTSADGRLMSVVQETIAPDGTVTRNFQVYERTGD